MTKQEEIVKLRKELKEYWDKFLKAFDTNTDEYKLFREIKTKIDQDESNLVMMNGYYKMVEMMKLDFNQHRLGLELTERTSRLFDLVA